MLVKKLIFNLELQVDMHRVLLDALKQEKELEASCQLEELEKIHLTRDFATSQIFKLEKRRIHIVNDIRLEMDSNAEISLDTIIQRSNQELRQQLTRLRNQLKEIVNEIQVVGKRNAEKAIARISCFTTVQEEVHKSFQRHSIYSVHGMISRPKGACLMRTFI